MFTKRVETHPSEVPLMLFADAEGHIQEHDYLRCMGRTGNSMTPLKNTDFIELPNGSELFFLKGRTPLGYDVKKQASVLFNQGSAVSAFIAPAYTQTYLAAYQKEDRAPILPLYAYTAVGWWEGKFYTTAIRIDDEVRQDVAQFDDRIVGNHIKKLRKKYPQNRLIEHLAQNCASTYHCRAAQNYFLGRWECPIPSSPACNAECLGCISLQPEEHDITSSHFRLKFTPSVQEIVEIAVDHLEEAPYPIVSFGQGCEGEPLLVWETILPAIEEIRKKTSKGIINMNTNGSRPEIIEKLVKAGLQSIRVSMNSAQKKWYESYYLPRNYKFEDIKESIKMIRKHGGWASINYFTFPGLSDSVQEYEAIRQFMKDTDLSMIQWRNFNIDPDFYYKRANLTDPKEKLGTIDFMQKIRNEFPNVKYGYFNPSLEAQLS